MMTTNQKAKLLAIFNTLDAALGDTDVDVTGMTQQEIQEEEPVFWCAKEIAKILGKDWDKYANVLSQCEIPTPAELAQQLADLTGNAVVVYRQPEGHWMGCIFEDTCNIHDLPFRQGGEDPDNESWCDMGAFGEFFINRPVSTTGRWQDSKVTATPNQSGDATDNNY